MTEKKLAFLILAHSEPLVLEKLVLRLSDIGDVYIHLDKKTIADKYNKLKSIAYFVSDNKSVCWAGWSMVEATLRLLKSASLEKKYSKYILLSGQDYPIKSNATIQHALTLNQDNIVKSVKVSEIGGQEKYLKHHKYYYNYDIPNYINNKFLAKVVKRIYNRYLNRLVHKRKPDFSLFHGSQWVVLNDFSVKYIIDSFNKKCAVTQYLKYSFAPDEYYIHTLLGNCEHSDANTIILSDCDTNTAVKANIHLLDVSLKKYFSISDFDRINLSEMMFVRKVNEKSSFSLIDKLDSIAKE